ncbi:unnamed protein product [Phaeothamnion confervicola]
MLSFPEIGSDTLEHVAFSADGKLCLAQGGAPEWILALCTVEKAAKLLCTVKISSPGPDEAWAPPVHQADFCPSDATVVCVTGDRVLRFFRVADNQFKPMPLTIKQELQHYLCHTWLPDDRVIVGSAGGELLLLEAFDFRCVLPCSLGGGRPVTALAPTIKGFVSGGPEGTLRVFERSDDARENFKCLKTFRVDGGAHMTLTNMALSPSEDTMALTTHDHQMYSFNLGSTDILREDANNFERLCPSFHVPFMAESDVASTRVNGVAACIKKPLVASVGADRTFRLWNHQEKTAELVKQLTEEPLAVALHPSGLFAAAAFKDKARLYSILMDDLRELRAFPVKHCRVVSFSHGGQYLALATNNQVMVYLTHTCAPVSVLRGHQGRVAALSWRQHDHQIMTASSEGQLVVWETATGRRLPDTVQLRAPIECAASATDFSRHYCATANGKLYEIALAMPLTEGQAAGSGADASPIRLQLEVDVPLSCMQVAERAGVLLCGTAASGRPGCVRAYSLTLSGLGAAFTETPCLAGPVTGMRLSHDKTQLFVCGDDGAVAVFDVLEDGMTAARRRKEREVLEFTEEILLTRGELETRNRQMQELKAKVDELVLNNEYQLRLKDMNYKEKTAEVANKFAEEMAADQRRYEELLRERGAMESEYERRVMDLQDRQQAEHEASEHQHATRINGEVARYQSLVHEKEDLNRKWDAENQALVEEHAQQLQDVMDKYDAQIEEEMRRQAALTKEKDAVSKAFAATTALVEEDADKETMDVKAKYVSKLAAEREATLRLKGENGIMKKKFGALNKQVEEQRDEIRTLQDRQRELQEGIRGLEKDIQGHKKEIREREETVADKERRIYDLKKKNQELEKFKFVLDYKIKELKRQIEPRQNEIVDMRNQIEEMDLELEQYHKSNSALDLMIGELRLKLDGMQREADAQEKRIVAADRHLAAFAEDVQALMAARGDHRRLKQAAVTLFRRYVQGGPAAAEGGGGGGGGGAGGASGGGGGLAGGGGGGSSNGGGNLQREYNRQREHLERNVEALKRSIEKDASMFHADKARLHRENVMLTGEINDLRRESKQLALHLNAVNDAMAGVSNVDFSLLLGPSNGGGGRVRGVGSSIALKDSIGGGSNFAFGGGNMTKSSEGATPGLKGGGARSFSPFGQAAAQALAPAPKLFRKSSGGGGGLPDEMQREIETQESEIAALEEQARRLRAGGGQLTIAGVA